jgi:VanZ like family
MTYTCPLDSRRTAAAKSAPGAEQVLDFALLTGAFAVLEHFTAFALVTGAFAIGYRLSLVRLLLLALLFCGGIELLQVALPTRHARLSDFVIDFAGACFAIAAFFLATNSALGLRFAKLQPLAHQKGGDHPNKPFPPEVI